MSILREYIREIFRVFEDKDTDLLVEPDESDEEEKTEISAGGVAGAMTPLGTGSTYPNGKKKKKKKKPVYGRTTSDKRKE